MLNLWGHFIQARAEERCFRECTSQRRNGRVYASDGATTSFATPILAYNATACCHAGLPYFHITPEGQVMWPEADKHSLDKEI